MIENVEVLSSIAGREYKSIQNAERPYPIKFDKDSSDGNNITSVLNIAADKGEKVTMIISTRYKTRGAIEEKPFVITQEWHPNFVTYNPCVLPK